MFRLWPRMLALLVLALQVAGCKGETCEDCCVGCPPNNADMSVAPATPPGCVGSCMVAYCSSGSETTVTGTVTIPAGTLPLAGALVFIPSGYSVPAVPGHGPTCDSSPFSELLTAVTTTDVAGRFTLTRIPSGQNIPLVIRVGKWQRVITLPPIADCTTTALPPDQTRLPRNQSEGSIPRIAVSTGGEDAIECLLRSAKLGLDDSEFTSAGGTGSVQLYAGATGANSFTAALGGGAFTAAQPLPAKSWYDDPENWNKYDAVLLSCEGAQYMNFKSAQALQNLETFLNKGGRVFATHWHNGWLQNAPAPLPTVATFGGQSGPDPGADRVGGFSQTGLLLAPWLGQPAVMGSSVDGTLLVHGPGYTIANVNSSAAQSWLSYQPASGPAIPQAFSFWAPLAAPRCGKMVFSDVHVSAGASGDSSTAGTPFPSGCTTTSLSPQEKAMIFMLFDVIGANPTVG